MSLFEECAQTRMKERLCEEKKEEEEEEEASRVTKNRARNSGFEDKM